MIYHEMDLPEIHFPEGSDGLSDLTLPVKREEDFALLRPLPGVRKQVDEMRDVTRCTPFQLLEHFQEPHILLRFLGDNFSSRNLGRIWKQRGHFLPYIIRSQLV